ncbi:YbjN domain-containing protein [Erythrobacter sp. NE805]|uniref:YbjN domain-containing protein n=1 Tax=Erythrobacter sp. NE805 TaxID=3389875 RepID=UPI00396B2DF0
MRSTRLAAAAAIAMLALGSAAGAQNKGALQKFTRADFERALTEAGATIKTPEEPSEHIDFTFEDGVIADGLLLACEDEATQKNCLGSSLLATFSPQDGATPEQIQDAINTYNYRENFGRAYLDPEGTISVRMYIIADGGITRENYARQIGLWFNSVLDFFGYLYTDEEASAEDTKAS